MPTGFAPGGGFGGGSPAPLYAFVPGSSVTVFDGDAFATRRGDYLGMTTAERKATLEARLVQGVSLYAALMVGMPDRSGAGGEECSDPAYARVEVTRWLTVTEGASVRRTSARAIRWPIFGEPQTLVGWSLWTAASGGTMRFFDYLRTPGTERRPVGYTVPAGSRFSLGSGRNGIGLVL